MHKLTVEYSESIGNAGVSLSWKRATTAAEVLPSAVSFPTEVVDDFVSTTKLFHRAGKFISGFKLTDKEVYHFVNYNTDFDNIDFNALTPVHWQRINDFVQLRNIIPQSQGLLTDVFIAANISTPAPIIDDLIKKLYLVSSWDLSIITDLVKNYFAFSINDFKNEKTIIKIKDAVSFIRKTGLSSKTLAQWAAPETDFDKLDATADLVKSAVKAKYEEVDWLKLAGDLSDKIRENKKQALVSYLLTKQELIDWGVKDADRLFEYLLIDVQMGACMDTSRIVQANAAIQMFVNRCLLNLESDTSTGVELGVSPDAIDKDRWKWMQYYRVWEVNRKIFLYPENWLEPEWRDDRSPFFKELESELVQNDITDRSVETAFRNYLTKLSTVANLDICGMYQENYSDGNTKMLHIFGRTHNAPYQFFYRTCDEFYKWSTWEKVQVDIRMTEDGENSGVHLIPVVWKNRLFIFWAEFIKKQLKKVVKEGSRDANFQEIGKKAPSTVEPIEYFEIRLAWAEYIDGKWSSKQLTKEFLEIGSGDSVKKYTFRPFSSYTDQSLSVTIRNDFDEKLSAFILSDIQSQVVADPTSLYGDDQTYSYANNFMKHSNSYQLTCNGDVYLEENLNHNILYSPQWMDFESRYNYPFFYQALNRTYFVRSSYDVKVLEYVKYPDCHPPAVVSWIDDIYFVGSTTPAVGPDPVDFTHRVADTDPISDRLIDNLDFEMAGNIHAMKTIAMKSTPKIMSKKNAGVKASVESSALEMEFSATKLDMVKLGDAFSGIAINNCYTQWHWAKGLEFHTFFHPYSSQFVTNLNTGGIDGLMQSDTLRDTPTSPLKYKDSGSNFIANYNPNFSQNLVKQIFTDEDYKSGEAYTYYKENVCFDEGCL